MKKELLQILKCPHCGSANFKVFAKELRRNEQRLKELDHEQIRNTDNIITGVLISEDCQTAFPVSESVAVLLSEQDMDIVHYKILIDPLKNNCPALYNDAITQTLKRLNARSETYEGKWNREEMQYYDKEVGTPELREKMLYDIKHDPVWRILIPRQKEITRLLEPFCANKNMLEIGSGNSRSIYQILNPSKYKYNYTGTDISFYRLVVAQQAIPDADFIQASTFNLPFADHSFDIIISFGMLHHLPDPQAAIYEADKKIKTNGWFAFHEPVHTPRKILKDNKAMRKLFGTYQHSEHDNKINLDQALSLLRNLNYSILNFVPYNSVFRAFFETILKKFSKNLYRKKKFNAFLIAADHLLLKTVCKISKKLGPQGAIVVAKKSE